MNMKKAIAGVFAGAVAISAVATTMASAKTVSYAAIDQTFNLKASGYKASNYAKTTVKSYAKDSLTSLKTVTSGITNGVTITAADNVGYTINLAVNAGLGSDFTVGATGTTITITVRNAASLTVANIQSYLNLYKANNFAVSGTPTPALDDGDSFTLTTTVVTPIQIQGNIDKGVSSLDTLTINFSQPIENFKVTFDAVGTYGDVTLSEAKPDENDDDGISMSADRKTITINKVTLPADSYVVNMSYDVKAISDKTYKYKSEAEKANPDTAVVVTASATDLGAGTGTTTLFEAIAASTVDSFTAKFEVKGSDNTYPKLKEGTKSGLVNWTGDVTNGVYKGEDVVDAVSEAIEGRLKAQVIFNFDDPKWVGTDDVNVTVWFDTKDYGILKKTVKMDTSKWTATVDWADIVKSATSGTSTLGDISNKLDDIVVLVDSRDVDGKEIALKSITVKGPSESADVLSAGESVADTTAAITTAATTTAATTTATEATTTAAASNPKTGNAPVALAVIPVAIAAAAIIAKKRG